MLAVFLLPVLLFSQLAAALPSSELSLRDLEELYKLLNEEKRNLEREDSLIEMSKRKESDMIEKCDQVPLELGIIIDSSRSISRGDYKKGLDFVSRFLNKYVISPDMVRVAAVSFGRGVYTSQGFNLSTYNNNADVVNHIQNMKHQMGGSTDTGDAIQHMRDVQMSDDFTRPGVPKMIIVVTDGNSQLWMKTQREGITTKNAGIKAIAVGVGRGVKKEELIRIAGGEVENVIQSANYSMLNDDFMHSLFSKTCILVPRPTTLPPPTTTMQAIEPCGEEFPTDINFVFNPATLDLDHTVFATRFVERVMEQEQLTNGTQYGLVTGVCPMDAGFTLGDYSQMSKQAVKERLRGYEQDKLPDLVKLTTQERFSTSTGGQRAARKVAVIFVGPGKMDTSGLKRRIDEMVESGVEVYVSTKDWNTHNGLSRILLPSESITMLSPDNSALEQAVEMTNDMCAPVFQ